jgi:hypothetical protein
MNNKAMGVAQGRDIILYNAFDWEHFASGIHAITMRSSVKS